MRGIHGFKITFEHQHFAAHLEQRRSALRKPHRYRANGPQIESDVLATVAVAARRADREQTALVGEAYREPIEFGLGFILDTLAV